MFKVIEKFFRGIVTVTPSSWQVDEDMPLPHDYRLEPIKQKFGTLRYYCTPSNSKHKQKFVTIVDKYERLSIKVCEISGKDGVLMKKDGWLKTLNPTLGKTLGYEKCKADQ